MNPDALPATLSWLAAASPWLIAGLCFIGYMATLVAVSKWLDRFIK